MMLCVRDWRMDGNTEGVKTDAAFLLFDHGLTFLRLEHTCLVGKGIRMIPLSVAEKPL